MTLNNGNKIYSYSEHQLGWWTGSEDFLKSTEEEIRRAIDDINSPVFVVKQSNEYKIATKGTICY